MTRVPLYGHRIAPYGKEPIMSSFPRVTAEQLERASLRSWSNPRAPVGQPAILLAAWLIDLKGVDQVTEACRRLGLSWQEVR